jgi:DNA modification methylase
MKLVPRHPRGLSPTFEFECVSPASLAANPRNARQHDHRQIGKLTDSIRKFGFLTAVVADHRNILLCGHARVEAAKQLRLPAIPVIRVSHLNESEKRAFMLADNRLAEIATWNKQFLRSELQFLSDLDLDFDFGAIGFDTAQVDFILGSGDELEDSPEQMPPSLDTPPASRAGDLWLLGEHRVHCGDALKADAYGILLGGEQARMVFTDPPYNVRVDGHVGGRGAVRHREFAMASGEMTDAQFQGFLGTACDRIGAALCDGAIAFICMDWRHARALLQAANAFELKNICVWVKNNGGMGSLYRSQHEFVFVYKVGAASHINNVELGKHGRSRTNVWEYRGANSFGSDRDELLRAHPTVKPLALVADAIKDCARRGDLILDPFGGSGTTLIAAEKT